jgi:hypothetical protein
MNRAVLMAASSGITVGAQLAQAFATACSGATTRVFKVLLQGETLVCSDNLPSKSSDADDFAMLQSVLVDKQSCYICYRMDSPPPCCWVFIMYVPNGTSVRDRMLYAATREATKTAFGGNSVFCHEMHCSSADEATFASYSADIKASAAPAPKTDGEVLKERLKLLEIAEASSGGGAAGSAGANVSFPLSSQAKAAIAKIASGAGQWITAFNVMVSVHGSVISIFTFQQVSGTQIDVVLHEAPVLQSAASLAASAAAFLQVVAHCVFLISSTFIFSPIHTPVRIRGIARFCPDTR